MSQEQKPPFGLSVEEYNNLKDLLRYGITIVLAVAVTYVLVAVISGAFGYQPPDSPFAEDATPAITATSAP